MTAKNTLFRYLHSFDDSPELLSGVLSNYSESTFVDYQAPRDHFVATTHSLVVSFPLKHRLVQC